MDLTMVTGRSEVDQVRADKKRRAKKTEDVTRSIVQHGLAFVPLDKVHMLPS